jgi:TM2 domain-containing membrane protein YozV
MKNKSLIAFSFSLILPGAGQIYNQTFFRGVLWLMAAIILWLNIGAFAIICHLFSAVTAYNYVARKMGQEEVWPDL